MNFRLVIAAMSALLCGGGIFMFSRKLRRFHKFIGFTFIFEGLVSLMAGAVLPGIGHFSTALYLLYVTMLLVAPAFYYFAVRFLLKESDLRGRDFWMLQTAFVFVVLSLSVIWAIPQWDKDVFFRVMASLDAASFALFLAEYLFIQLFCIMNLPRYQKSLENYYSNLEGISFRLVTVVLVLMGIRFIALAAMGFMAPSVWVSMCYTAVSVAFYVSVAFCVCRTDFTAEELGRMTEIQESRSREPVANDVIKSRLEKLVSEGFFLDADINLMDMAALVHINTKYLSEFLKYHYGETFLAYVNRLRIEHSIPLIESGNLTMEEIAEQSGFTNVSTFYRNFIKLKGISPSKFRK